MSVERFCREWSAFIADPDSAEGKYKRWQSCNVFYRGREIYSYGDHFVMGYIVSPGVVWLNGDRYSNTTSRHQATLRTVLRGRADVLIVPGSALDAARIDYSTIKPVSIESERFETIEHDSDVPPAGMRTDVPRYPYATFGAYGGPTLAIRADGSADSMTLGAGQPAGTYVGYVTTEHRNQAVMLDSGRYRWHTFRHWLGDSVFTAERYNSAERVYWLSSFDRQESRPLYFLSQLPGPADSVDSAIELLAPESVKTARDMGRTVVRQGDMFAIETETTTRQLRALGARLTRRAVSIKWSINARRAMAVRDALQTVRATMPAYPERVYYESTLSRGAFDAMRAWHDDRVTEWETELLARYHAANPSHPELNRWQWASALRYAPSVRDKIRDVTAESLLNTAHTATEVATLPNGLQYARGCLYHEPDVIGDSRDRDHARRPLPGKRWYLIARNTVPVAPSRRRIGLSA